MAPQTDLMEFFTPLSNSTPQLLFLTTRYKCYMADEYIASYHSKAVCVIPTVLGGGHTPCVNTLTGQL